MPMVKKPRVFDQKFAVAGSVDPCLWFGRATSAVVRTVLVWEERARARARTRRGGALRREC